jgi:Ankyrin repeat
MRTGSCCAGGCWCGAGGARPGAGPAQGRAGRRPGRPQGAPQLVCIRLALPFACGLGRICRPPGHSHIHVARTGGGIWTANLALRPPKLTPLRLPQAAAGHFGESGIGGVRDGNGRTALHFAAQVAQLDACRLLLEQHRMDVNAQDDHGAAGKP